MKAYFLFKQSKLFFGTCITFPNNRNDVHFVMKSPHELHIYRPQAMPRRSNEVKAGMNPGVRKVDPVHLCFCL